MTADLREIPLRVTIPASPTFTIHRASGDDQIFTLQRASLHDAPGVIVYIEKQTAPPDGSFVPLCPVCGGHTEGIRDVGDPTLFACRECETRVSVPSAAWMTAHAKRAVKWQPKK